MVVSLGGGWRYWMMFKVAVDNSDFGGNLTRLKLYLIMVYTNLRRGLVYYTPQFIGWIN